MSDPLSTEYRAVPYRVLRELRERGVVQMHAFGQLIDAFADRGRVGIVPALTFPLHPRTEPRETTTDQGKRRPHMTATPRPCDSSKYYTVLNPERYDGDWQTFYNDGYQKTLQLSREVRSEMQVMYGEDSFQVLDVFAPHGASNAPVVVFFHGGGFKEGHPSHYGFFGEKFVEQGALFVSAGYRLEPDCEYPDCAADGASALRWVIENIATYGGNPRNLYLVGHSAGAMIVALLSFRKEFAHAHAHAVPLDAIQGTVLLSGAYDFSITDSAYTDARNRPAEWAAVYNIETTPRRVIISYGSPEAQRVGQSLDYFKKHGEALARALRDYGSSPEVVILPDTNHLGVGLALQDGTSPLHSAVRAMVFS